MPVKKQKDCHDGLHKMFLGLVLIIAALIFWVIPEFKDAWMYTFFVVGILFILKGLYLSSK